MEFSEGLAAVAIGGKWGFIDSSGQFIVKPQYGQVWSFSEGLAVFCLGGVQDPESGFILAGGAWGFIDKIGEVKVKPIYNESESFQDGLAMVRIGEKRGYIDSTGILVWQPQK
jgi:hypothetical protein